MYYENLESDLPQMHTPEVNCTTVPELTHSWAILPDMLRL